MTREPTLQPPISFLTFHFSLIISALGLQSMSSFNGTGCFARLKGELWSQRRGEQNREAKGGQTMSMAKTRSAGEKGPSGERFKSPTTQVE